MKRMWWLGAGYAAGLGTAAWLRSKVRRAAQRYAPESLKHSVLDRSRDMAGRARHVAADGAGLVTREAKRVVDDLRSAAAQGRAAMRDTESALRDEGADRRTCRDAPGPPGAAEAQAAQPHESPGQTEADGARHDGGRAEAGRGSPREP